MEKVQIDAFPKEGTLDCSHLQPIVDYLIKHGNETVNDYIWGNSRTGYFCHLKHDIDFPAIKEKFIIPDSIKIDESNQSIDCFNTYSIIRKL